MNQIERVFVIRRNLSFLNFHYKILAHSALLVRTKDGKYHMVEYTKNKQHPGGVALSQSVTFTVLETHSDHELIKIKGDVWTKQKTGKAYHGPLTVEQARKRMMELMPEGYKLFKEEFCHTGQMRLRKDMGIY